MDNDGYDRCAELEKSLRQLRALRENERFEATVRMGIMREHSHDHVIVAGAIGFLIGVLLVAFIGKLI